MKILAVTEQLFDTTPCSKLSNDSETKSRLTWKPRQYKGVPKMYQRLHPNTHMLAIFILTKVFYANMLLSMNQHHSLFLPHNMHSNISILTNDQCCNILGFEECRLQHKESNLPHEADNLQNEEDILKSDHST